MIDVVEVPLALCLPSTAVRMVLMQPHIRFEDPLHEPYRWHPGATASQLAAIQRTLDIGRGASLDQRSHFTIFPEYSIPGLAGVKVIDDVVASDAWPCDSMVLAGIDGLSRDEYVRLYAGVEPIIPLNGPDRLRPDAWVNACVIWAKETNGRVRRFVQLKIRPCELERNVPCRDMFHGTGVHVFQCGFENHMTCRFMPMICFDWIAPIQEGDSPSVPLPLIVLSKLDAMWRSAGERKSVHWVFVLQCNDEPNAHDVLRNTEQFLLGHDFAPAVDRRGTAVVFANTASCPRPLRKGKFGFSSLVFEPNSPFVWKGQSRPTVSIKYNRVRDNGGFSRCRDATFREMGACIHSAAVRVIDWTPTGTPNRCSPVDDSSVHALAADSHDPRLPGAPVPPAVKWVNDSLDTVPFAADRLLSGEPMGPEVRGTESTVRDNLRLIDGDRLANRMYCSVAKEYQGEKALGGISQDADDWTDTEESALWKQVAALAMLGICHPLTTTEGSLHGTLDVDGLTAQVLCITGKSYLDCRKHCERVAHGVMDPVFLVADDGTGLAPTEREWQRIDEPGHNSFVFCDFHTLCEICRASPSSGDFAARIRDNYPIGERRIIGG